MIYCAAHSTTQTRPYTLRCDRSTLFDSLLCSGLTVGVTSPWFESASGNSRPVIADLDQRVTWTKLCDPEIESCDRGQQEWPTTINEWHISNVIYFKKCELRITDLNLISKILTHVENPDFQTHNDIITWYQQLPRLVELLNVNAKTYVLLF